MVALKNVSFDIHEKETVGLIGPNGAGKTTLVNVVSGVYKPDSGTVKFLERDITTLTPEQRCHMGIARTYQIPQPFLDMTVHKNVAVACLYGKKRRISVNEALDEAKYFLEVVDLADKMDVTAGNLSIYELRKLELARALATRPKLLLIDEVMAGLTPLQASDAVKLINQVLKEKFNLTILWIEHVMSIIMNAAERIVVLHYGEKIAEGTPKEVSKNKKVIEAYLGESVGEYN